MKNRTWRGSAPSNIALIKYMGKTNSSENRPTNASLSYTLEHLRTFVELELKADLKSASSSNGTNSIVGQSAEGVVWASEDAWEPLTEFQKMPLVPIELSSKGQARFLNHLRRLKSQFDFQGSFVLRSGNNFPSDCGLASSASSFAALTIVAANALSELTDGAPLPIEELAELSRLGSGSSCRSFFSPWSIWNQAGAGPAHVGRLADTRLIHQVVVLHDAVKSVSSSEAHVRVSTSLLFAGRVERAEQRLKDLCVNLQAENWKELYEISWSEFWDMHALFESSRPSFGYMNGDSLEILRLIQELSWQDSAQDGPIITMDAGPNIHLLYREDQAELANRIRAAIGQRPLRHRHAKNGAAMNLNAKASSARVLDSRDSEFQGVLR